MSARDKRKLRSSRKYIAKLKKDVERLTAERDYYKNKRKRKKKPTTKSVS